MDYYKRFSKCSKFSLICAFIFLIYGYIARLANIYFFWESKSLGFALLLICLISLLYDSIRIRKIKNKEITWNKIGIGLIIFILLSQIVLITVVLNSAPYKVAKNYIRNNQDLVIEFGVIKGFGLIPTGGIEVTKDSNGEKGAASLNMIIKGQKKYEEVTVFVSKNVDSVWKVEEIR